MIVTDGADGGGCCVFGNLFLLLRFFHSFRWKRSSEVSHLRNLLPSGER